MEKDGLFGSFNWQPDHRNISVSAAVAAVAEMNNNNNNISNNSGSCDNGNGNGNGADQSSVLAATSSFLNLNWDQSSADQTANFESALSSLVSSPTTSNPNPNPSAASADSLVIRELIGRLGSICNNNTPSDASPPNSSHYQSTNNSCYSTPLNSPPKLSLLSMMDRHPQFHLARAAAAGGGNMGNNNNNNNSHRPIPFAADPGFAERAARFSCFGAATATATARNYTQFSLQEPGKLSRVSSSQSLKGMTASINGVGMNVNHSNPMHLQQPQQPDGMGSGIGGQLENEMVMMMMMRSGREFGSSNTQEESSASGRMAPNVNMNVNEGNVRKRKATTPSSNKGGSSSSGGGAGRKEATPAATPNPNPPKRGEEENSNSKRSKSAAATGEAEANADGTHAVKTPKAEQNSTSSEPAQKQGKDKNKNKDMDNNVNPPEPPKQDYIHVRARRGQATDSHSLAERVRREKISERMKFLQDLVPGCNKVTGKAVMLDEIINYVQSLQRQVEFLSMKLATVNPRLDINVDNLLTKDVHQPRGPMMAPQSSYPLEATSNGFSYANLPEGQNPLQSLIASNGLETQCSVNNPLDASSLLRRSLGMQLPSLEGFADAAAASQLGAFWEDDLQSVVQMGFGQNQEAMFSHNFQGPLPTSHMKIEL